MNGSSLQAERVTASAKAARMVVVFIAVVVVEKKKAALGLPEKGGQRVAFRFIFFFAVGMCFYFVGSLEF